MNNAILKNDNRFDGCDFVLQLGEERKNTKIKILQLTDMQIIDSTQQRTLDRLRPDEIRAWLPENIDALCNDHIRSLVAQTRPDLILITGDIIYGQFDDSGRTFKLFCEFMESLDIAWAPVFGNHDNESKIGVEKQCEMFENAQSCIFSRDDVSGNGNYTIGIAVGSELIKVMHMLDTHGCLMDVGIYDDQLELIKSNSERIKKSMGKEIPCFIAMHIPTEEFFISAREKGYTIHDENKYNIGVDVPALDGDFGYRNEKLSKPVICKEFLSTVQSIGTQAVLAGHCHSINTCVLYKGIKWVFGLKTGQYDYHTVGQLGGTLITLENKSFDVMHIPALTQLSPYPAKAPLLDGLTCDGIGII